MKLITLFTADWYWSPPLPEACKGMNPKNNSDVCEYALGTKRYLVIAVFMLCCHYRCPGVVVGAVAVVWGGGGGC